ncbi:Fanconi-associated nuclease 1 [Anthophora plagiata]
MSQQTRIDQFFKSFRGNKIPDMGMEAKKKETCVLLPQYTTKSDTMQDCEITYEKAHKSTSDLQLIEDRGIVQRNNEPVLVRFKRSYSKDTSQNVLDIKCSTLRQSSEDVTMIEIKVKASNNNEVRPKKIRKVSDIPGTNENNVSLTNNNNPPSTSGQSRSPVKAASSRSPRTTVRKGQFIESKDDDIVIKAIKHMNLARQGAIPLHNFNLTKVYSTSTFNYQYSSVDAETSVKYDIRDINLSRDLNSKILLTTIFRVFSNYINCGYFDENDLDFIYSIITLPASAQMLLARLIKRNRTWFRGSKIKYPEIEVDDLKSIFKILVSRSICTFDIESEDVTTVLELLHVPEINDICKELNISSKGTKTNNMQKLLQLLKTKPLFPGMKAPNSSVHSFVFKKLGYCVRVTRKTWDIIDRVITLLMPNEDPKSTMSEIFFKLQNIYLGHMIFPNNPGYHFPVFSNKLHLISYIEVKSVLFTILQLTEKKNWEQVQNYGESVIQVLSKLFNSSSSEHSALPAHVKRYIPVYVWLKILSKCVDAFKKSANKKRVVEVLKMLLRQNCSMYENKGKWYTELAQIEMYYNKNVIKTASIITKALNTETLTQVDKVNLIERMNKILEKKTQLKSVQRVSINETLKNHIHEMPKYKIPISTITGLSMPVFRSAAGYKTTWRIERNTQNVSYGSVENVACHYYNQQGFPNGLHCEGALPITLFFTLFWEELYDVHVPGSFVTPYQELPSDLFTPQFRANRQMEIDRKLDIIGRLDSESLASLMEQKFTAIKHYQTPMSGNFQNNVRLKEIVHCLGVEAVIGICTRLLDNYRLWRSGFPDLIVWNYLTKKCKIVEVKGPRDVLSTKQRLWLEYLDELGLSVEICLVRGKYVCFMFARR